MTKIQLKKLEKITKDFFKKNLSEKISTKILYPINTLEIKKNKETFCFSLISQGKRNNKIIINNEQDYNLASRLKEYYQNNYPKLGDWLVDYNSIEPPSQREIERFLAKMN